MADEGTVEWNLFNESIVESACIKMAGSEDDPNG